MREPHFLFVDLAPVGRYHTNRPPHLDSLSTSTHPFRPMLPPTPAPPNPLGQLHHGSITRLTLPPGRRYRAGDTIVARLGIANTGNLPLAASTVTVLNAETFRCISATFGEEKIRSYLHETCWTGARHLAAEWDTPFGTPESMIGAMAVVHLPPRLGTTAADAETLRRHLNDEHRVEVPIFAVGGSGDEPDAVGAAAEPGLVVRICTQVYNDSTDIDRLTEAVRSVSTA